MVAVFKRGSRVTKELLKAGRYAEAHSVIEMLGMEAITEHAQWLILRRARPFELHVGG